MIRLREIGAGGWLQAILVLAIGWFYFWTAVPEWHPGLIAKSDGSYYNLLARGFMRGQLSLDLPADPFLATLKNPYDFDQRAGHGAHDVTYFHGKYYIYFGVAPVLLVFLPFRLLTGNFIDDSLVVPLFACGGLTMAVLLLRAVRARYFAAAPAAAVTGCVAALGLANLVPMLLRRSNVWEVPIACGCFCCMTAFYALFKAWHSPRPAPWLAMASGAFGLAVASRPTYLLGCVALPLALASLLREELRRPASRAVLRLVLAALLPIAAVGTGLALYNYLRFGNPADFGWRHMLNADPVGTAQMFGWRFFWYNLRVYALAPAGWSPYFPYVALAHLPVAPAGFMVAEDPYGVLPNIPFVLLGLGIAGMTGRRRHDGQNRLPVFCAAIGAEAAGTGLTTASFAAAANRYLVDFLPALVVLACIGLLVVVTRPWYRGWVSRLGNPAIAGLLAYSVLFNVLVDFRHNELLRDEHAKLYSRIAHAGNFPSDVVDVLLRHEYGPVELKVIFPQDKRGMVEPLVVTGRKFLSDYLFVHYLGPNVVRFGLDHTSRGSFVGEPVEIRPGAVQTLRIDLGSLYPPSAHPYFDAMSPDEARRRQETLRVTINGRVALERKQQFYDASFWRPSIGSAGERLGFPAPFSGRIISCRRLPDASMQAPPDPLFGPIRLKLILPPFSGPRSEPLLSTGRTGHGDLVYLHYSSADQISFGYDHWGTAGRSSGRFTVDPRALQVIEIDFGALHPVREITESPVEISGRPLIIRLNGETVFDEMAPFWSCGISSVAVATNAIRASTATDFFTGTLGQTERLKAEP